MKTNKHTPGPWKIDGGMENTRKGPQMFVWSDRDEKGKGYLGTHEVCVATIHGRIFEEGQNLSCVEEGVKANARLIAAAPDLLAACESIIRTADNGDTIEPDLWILNRVREAISKAKGGSQ